MLRKYTIHSLFDRGLLNVVLQLFFICHFALPIRLMTILHGRVMNLMYSLVYS